MIQSVMNIKYDSSRVEKKWQKQWEQEGIWDTKENSSSPKFYVLDMFPYPSAQGLHVGHPEGYTASDIVARFYRMKGYHVLHPMGFDSFGLPAENYAIKTGTHPATTTAKNINNMRRQIKSLGFSYDWKREVITSDPEYYKWTQWIFLQLFKHGLAYESYAPINWCPKDKTGLANEEVINGKCERCGTPVVKKKIKQWLVKITDEKYIERLLHGLDDLDWPESIKTLQRNWIGRSEGAIVNFELWTGNKEPRRKLSEVLSSKFKVISVFTTRPDTLFGATYMVLSPEHELVDLITTEKQFKAVEKYKKESAAKSDLERTDLAKEKTGVFTGAYAINPVNNAKIPVWIADYVLSTYGTGAIMAVPAHDERDFEFAKKFKLPIIQVIKPPSVMPKTYPSLGSASAWGVKEADLESQCWTGDGTMVNSGQFNGISSEQGRKKIVEWLNSKTEQVHNACLIVHGISGHKRENWFPWLKEELNKAGWETIVPTMPGAGHPVLNSWDEYLGQFDQRINENSVLVGHSLGCASILFHLQQLEKKVDTVILVAPTNPLQYWPQLKQKYPQADWDAVKNMSSAQNFNWPKIRSLAKRFIIIHSDNDPYVPPESMAYYKENLPEAEIHCMPGKSHFSESTGGVTSLPEILPFFPKSSSNSSVAQATINYKLRDWLFSRQRYWGEPIPIIHCEICGQVPVPEKDLPVLLPDVKKYEPTGTGESPLANIKEWVNVKCPQCGGPARRETNTMPQWAGSNWYFLRYCDAHNDKQLADPEKLKKWLPVNLYIGGAEHAVLHLLYARFIYKFLFDIKAVPEKCGDEPFKKLKNQGLILGEDGQKMSKSRGNVVNPDEVIEKYGADTMRMYEMFMGPFEDAKPWNMQGIIGVRRFLDRLYKAGENVADVELNKGKRSLHTLIKFITNDIENFKFNTCVSHFMEASNEWFSEEIVPREAYETFLVLLSPFAPHLAEELWEKLGHKKSIFNEKWPEFDPKLIVKAEITLVVQVNGRVRDQFTVPAGISETEAQERALASEKIKKWLGGKQPKKTIFVPGRLINFVV
ncbi:MAG: leucine--tRNA ligase [Patescibacteria group bacterium]|jgi:leucyl-tRNA synthetase